MTHAAEDSRLPDIDTQLAAARDQTWAAVHEIAARVHPGMRESEAIKIAQETLVRMGSKKFWHKCHVRFGSGTTKSFDDAYTDEILKPDDIYYVDIGPIWDGIEGDAGETFVNGKNPDYARLKADVRAVFDAVKRQWQTTEMTGQALYEFANGEAERRGWVLAPSYVRGHRLAEFPHSFHSKLTLGQVDFQPAPSRWMLEIHICDPALQYGGFFEDLL